MTTVIDLFCGCGGISWGFKLEGFGVRLGADMNTVALKTFARNFPEAAALNADLAEFGPEDLLGRAGLAPGELDVLVGGPPCQGFSKNVPASMRWLSDPRNLLVLRYMEFVRAAKPKVVLMENVAEMRGAYGESYTTEINKTFAELGYQVRSARLNAADFGVPQLRRRTIFFANRLGVTPSIPKPTHVVADDDAALFQRAPQRPTVWEAISDLPSLKSGEGESPCAYATPARTEYQRAMRNGHNKIHDHVARALTDVQLERVRHLKPGSGDGASALPEHLRPKMGYSGAYARLLPDEQARTITRWVFHPGSGRFYHPFQDRVITIREAARLQSFTDDFIFEGTYVQKAAQVGEAVPPFLARAFAREVLRILCADAPIAARGARARA